jgi:uncharacterized protein YigE (DUF2233 family)
MKRKLTAYLLSIAVLLSSLILTDGSPLKTAAAAQFKRYGEATTKLTENASLTQGVFYTDSRQEEHYISYTPNTAITPVVVYGDKLLDKGDFKTFAALLEKKGWSVVGGVNGDYYVVATAMPVGIIISEGRLISSDAGNWALGFKTDGSAFFGKPNIKSRIYIDSESYRFGGINKTMDGGDYYLYTSDFGADTMATKATANVVFTLPEGVTKLSPSCELELTVESITDSTGPFPIPEGKLVMSFVKGTDSWREYGLSLLSPGKKVKMTLSTEEGWAEADYAIGSLYRLVEGGVKTADLDKADKNSAPRTAVGIKADGTVIFYTVDGRQTGYSKGLTFNELADRLLELGCVEAGALDGGGSTNIQARLAGQDTYKLINSPSLGQEREVTSYIMLAAKNEGSGIAKTLSIQPYDLLLLKGASLSLSAGACDETGRPVSLGGVSWSGEGVDKDGLFKAPDTAGLYTVSAQSLDLTATLPVRVIDSPDTISVLNEDTGRAVSSLKLDFGQTVQLSAAAKWQYLDVYAKDTDFTWSVQGNIGTVDENGTFKASKTGGAGVITVSAGSCSYELSVAVKSGIMTGEDFEAVTPGASEGVSWSQEISMDYVRYGRGSMKADYELSEGRAVIPLDLGWAWITNYVTVWVYGDGSGNELYSRHKNGDVLLTCLDFRGWRQFTIRTGQYGGITGLAIDGQGSGTIWLDQMLLTDYTAPDLEAPYISLNVNKLMVYGSVKDAVDGCLEAENISLTLDGLPIAFEYDRLTGDIYAAIEESGELRRLTLKATDASGNVYSVSASTEGTFETVFSDTGGHWASDFINYMYKMGVVTGEKNKSGGSDFKPNDNVTRAQFAAMICRWRNIDPDSYASVSLGFSDNKDIPVWAVNYIKAVYSLGIMKGIAGDRGLDFKPNDTLTRAQAMTILGRTLEGGRMSADLSFLDCESIPPWSISYVSKLVFAGVIKGYEDGTLRPDGGLTRAQVCKILTEMT